MQQSYHFHKPLLIFLIHIPYIPVKFMGFLSGHPRIQPYRMNIMVYCPALCFPILAVQKYAAAGQKARCGKKSLLMC